MSEKCPLRFETEHPNDPCMVIEGHAAIGRVGLCFRCLNRPAWVLKALIEASTMEQIDAYAEALKGKDFD